MKRSDWLLLLLGFKGEGDSPALDPIRVQKGMFLLAQEGGIPESERYAFRPYNLGPYSSAVRSDLNQLITQGYVEARDVPGYSWKRYSLTAGGIDYARNLLHEDIDSGAARNLAAIKRRVSGASFNELLEDVYAEYPDYAVNSVFRK